MTRHCLPHEPQTALLVARLDSTDIHMSLLPANNGDPQQPHLNGAPQ